MGNQTLPDTDRNSVLAFLQIERNGGGVRLGWQGGTQAWQYVESTSLLATNPAAWQPVFTNVPPTPPTNWITMPQGTNGFRVFRVRAERR